MLTDLNTAILPVLVTFAISYPALPSMPARDLAPFHKGAQIAVENILDDYLRNTDLSLLEVIRDLGDKWPVVGGRKDDWERGCVLEGAEWVCEALRECWGGGVMGKELMEENDDRVGLEEGGRHNGRMRGYEGRGYAEEIDRDGEDGATKDARNNGAEHRTPQDEVESEGSLGTEGSGRAPGTIEFDELDDDDEIEPEEGKDESDEKVVRDGAEAQVVICLVRLIEKAMKEA